MGDGYTEYEFSKLIEEVVKSELRGDFTDLSVDEHDAWNAESVFEGYEYAGRWHEIVDGLVPVYNVDIVKTWLELGMPEGDEWGHDVTEMPIIQQMMVGIYGWADEYARDHFERWHEEIVSAELTNG
jgi:hypothetical protein